jgi:SAM-dependent methyltransferase
MEHLPYANSSFTAACGLTSFQYAQHPTRALSEAARVVRPGGTVVAMTGGTADECEAAACVAAIESLLPAPVGPAAAPFSTEPEALGALFTTAGLTAGEPRAVACPWYYPDERTALRGLLSAGPAVRAIGHSGEEAVAAAVLAAIAPYRSGNGSYLLRNTFYYTVAAV